MKQTAVEYLEHIYLTTGIDRNVHFNQAKEMEKKQLGEVWDEAIDEDSIYTTFEQYYNETLIRKTMDERDYKAMNEELNQPSCLGAVSGEFKPAYEYVIKNIQQGEGDFRSKILYATVERIGEGMVCSATVDFILRMYYGRRDKIENYEEVLGMFLDFYDKLIRRV